MPARECGAYGSGDRYAGVRALWAKVIIRAVFDYVSYRDSPKLMQRKLAESAQFWLFSANEMFNSFENVCTYLGIDAMEVREKAETMSKDMVSKIEHLERYPGNKAYLAKMLAIVE
jgi:hypothetical protein